MRYRIVPFYFFLFYIFLPHTSSAQYYTSAFGKQGTTLKTALHNIIKGHVVGTYSDLWNAFYTSDKRGSNQVWDIYSDIPGGVAPYIYTLGVNQCGTYSGEGDCYNREHTWPQNYFNGQPPMQTDLHHIFPTDGHVNGKRGSFPYGKVLTPSWTSDNGSKTGNSNNYPSYTLDVFEPIDSFKGDVARVYFYMSTRYEGEDAGWLNWPMANGAMLTTEAIALLMSWHQLDPVSQREKDRNEATYLIQQNRNPFIDYPIFADCIWGTGDCSTLNVEENDTKNNLSFFPNPATDQIILAVSLSNSSYSISDLTGREIQQGFVDALGIVHLHELEKGMYIFRLENNFTHASALFIKQ
jgi:endonuclease I